MTEDCQPRYGALAMSSRCSKASVGMLHFGGSAGSLDRRADRLLSGGQKTQ